MTVRARSTDPETSHQAAFAFESDQLKCAASVTCAVRILAQHGPLTDFQLAELWPQYWLGKFSPSLPNKARHWARQQGLVKHDGYGQHQGRDVRRYSVGRDHEFLRGFSPRGRKPPPACHPLCNCDRHLAALADVYRVAAFPIYTNSDSDRLAVILTLLRDHLARYTVHGADPITPTGICNK
jgi:hypothetical protein